MLAMHVVGGRPDWRTPIFGAPMASVVLSPHSYILMSIAEAEVLPQEGREPGYMARNEIRPYDAYFHDTTSRHLFAEPKRAFSHGCMRVEKPLDLAEYVRGPLGWDRRGEP